MNTISQQDQYQQLNIRQAIFQCEDELVKSIQDALDKYNLKQLEESQFRNLVRVAETTSSLEVVKNFLKYQVGRDSKWGKGKDSLAFTIIKYLDEDIVKKATDIAQKHNSTDVQSICLELTRRYLGYGARYLVYKKKADS